ncbi:helix-turn-helix domain-containing protein [Sphingomonas pituitosa]|uniref:helix-turn-helix domain-containing protein n=1 Tax=Sphingomonas pituitosa TaxID=99597 RepID=UPI000A04731F|nr:helix-turn-helix transcriptional regulator [Sphingomonas pituitosa]
MSGRDVSDSELQSLALSLDRMTALNPERVRQAMERAQHDQSSLARAIGVTPGTIHQIMSGKIKRSKFLPEIAEVLGVSLRWLRGEDVPSDKADEDALVPAPPPVRHLMMHVALPSEDALTQMFAALLALERPDDSRDERARFLAQLLPAALAQLQAQIPVEDVVASLARATKSQPATKANLARQ